MISADLLLKGLGGLAVVGGATTVGVCYQQEKWIFAKEKKETLEESAKKVGLVCNATSGQTEETGIECTIGDSGLSVKQNDTTKETAKKKGDATAGTTAGKIKGYKVGNGFKFVIEEGDIALKDGSASNVTKLEQFETYGVEEDGGKQYLTRKKKSWEEKRRLLGIPEETGCDFPESGTDPKECPLDKEKIKKLKFDGVTGEPTVKDPDGTPTLSLKISITPATTEETTQFPFGYKFTLISNKEITLGGNKSIKKDTNTEFKIKKSGTGKNISLSLEKAWTVNELAKKAGLKDCAEASGKKECSLGDSINVDNGENKKYKDLKKGSNGEGEKKVKYEENVGDHNQGFKFYVDEDADIALQQGTAVGASGGSGGDEKKILKKTGDSNSQISYEIKKDADLWYLTKKTTTPAAA